MRAEVIAIGDELTSGQRLDTNSQWLSRQLTDLGIRVAFHSTVGDDLEANLAVVRQAMQRADVVVLTGGLGPTADDLTREVLAAVMGVELELDHASLRHIESLFARRNRPMPERNRVQALLPRGAEAIPNEHGTAPGIAIYHEREGGVPVRVFALPGVPAEMKEMWQQWVAPRLESLRSRVIRHHVIKCFGVGESDLEAMLPDMIRRGRTPAVGITVSQATIALRITAEGPDAADCERQIDEARRTIEQCVGTLVFGTGEDELQHAVLRQLARRQATLSVVDAGTWGLAVQWLSEAAKGASEWFRGGIVLPASGGQALVPIDEGDTPEAMVARWASQCREHFGTDWALAIGPWPAVEGREGWVHFAVASESATITRAAHTAGHPEILRPRAAKQALNLVRLILQGELPST